MVLVVFSGMHRSIRKLAACAEKMDLHNIERLADSVDTPVTASTLLKAAKRTDGLYIQPAPSKTLQSDASRPVILVPTAQNTASVGVITDQAAARRALGVIGNPPAGFSCPRMIDGYNVFVYCPPTTRKIEHGTAVICLKDLARGPPIGVKPPPPAAPVKKTTNTNNKSRTAAVSSLISMLDDDEKEREGADELDADLQLLLPKPIGQQIIAHWHRGGASARKLSEAPTALGSSPKRTRAEEPLQQLTLPAASDPTPTAASSSPASGTLYEKVTASWGSTFQGPLGQRWHRPHPHVVATMLCPPTAEAAATLPAAASAAPIAVFLLEGAVIETNLFERGPEAYRVISPKLRAVLEDLHGRGYRVAFVASYPSLDGALSTNDLDERLHRVTACWSRDLGACVPVAVAVSVAAVGRRSVYTLPQTGLWNFVAVALSAAEQQHHGASKTGGVRSCVIGRCHRGDDKRLADDAASVLFANVATPDTVATDFAAAAQLAFVDISDLLNNGVDAISR